MLLIELISIINMGVYVFTEKTKQIEMPTNMLTVAPDMWEKYAIPLI